MDPDEQAREEVGVTTFVGGARWILLVGFVVTLVAFPLIDGWHRSRTGDGPGVLVSEAGDILTAWVKPGREEGGLWGWLFGRNAAALREIEDFEGLVNQTNVLRETLVAPYQGILYRYLRTGTIQVQVGRDGWLYFADDARYVTGGATGDAFGSAAEAVIAYRDVLRERGVELVVLPIPVKPVVEAGHLSGRIPGDHEPLHPEAYGAWVAKLEDAGVQVYDPTEDMVARRDLGNPVFLKADTHWRPETVVQVARRLGRVVEDLGVEPGHVFPDTGRLAVANRGDLWDLLETEDRWAVTGAESIVLERLRDRVGGDDATAPWVVVLGDSFVNIYATANLGWGTGAGLAEHLERRLGQRVERIAFNGDGVNAPREELRRRIGTGEIDAANLKVVVWAFAVRDLALKDWSPITGW